MGGGGGLYRGEEKESGGDGTGGFRFQNAVIICWKKIVGDAASKALHLQRFLRVTI